MKDLNRTEVYSLDGITHEQAEELLQWLIENYTYWKTFFLEEIKQGDSFLEYISNEWVFSTYDDFYNPTTHISTLFEPSYEEQLIEALECVKTLKAKIKEQKLTQL